MNYMRVLWIIVLSKQSILYKTMLLNEIQNITNILDGHVHVQRV